MTIKIETPDNVVTFLGTYVEKIAGASTTIEGVATGLRNIKDMITKLKTELAGLQNLQKSNKDGFDKIGLKFDELEKKVTDLTTKAAAAGSELQNTNNLLKKGGSNSYKTAKTKLRNLMSYMSIMSRKTKKHQKNNRKH